MKKLLAFVFAVSLVTTKAQVYPSSNINLLAHLDPESGTGTKYSGCWGWYQQSKNREYALAQGTSGRLFFVDVTIPTAPIVCDTVVGGAYMNREVQTYQNYCYSVSGGGPNAGFQIIDMNYLPDSVHVVYSGINYFKSAHTIHVSGNKLFAASVTYTVLAGPPPRSDMNVYSLATPSAPILLRSINQDYTLNDGIHDVFVRNDTVYASAMSQGLIVYRFNTPGNTFTQLGSFTGYPEAGYNHSSSLTSDGKTLVMCDEIPSGVSIKNVNVQNLSNMNTTAFYKPNSFTDFVAHNPYVKGNKWAYVSCYQDGLQVYDISDPQNPVLAGYFDTYPQGGANIGNYGPSPYNGNWGSYPYLPSGNIIALDMTNGLFILQTNPTIGMKENSFESTNSINISPVPALTNLNIELFSKNAGTICYSIRNTLGELIEQGSDECSANCKWNKKIDVSNLSKGVYFLNMKLNGENSEKKIVIGN